MKMGTVIIIVGIIMFGMGLVMFYSIEVGEKDPTLRLVKNTGTFIGLSGMGVTLAGLLLYVLSKNEPPIRKSFDI